jgi:hypothetical protein
MTPESAGAMEPPAAGMGEFSRITGVFFEPKKTFEDIAQRPKWLVPMVLTIIFGMLFCVAVGQRIGWDTVAQQQFDQRAAKMTPDQRAQAAQGLELSKKITPVIGYLSAVIAPAIMYLISAAVLLGIVAGMMSAPVRFKQIWAIMCYSGMPGLIAALLMVLVVFLKANPAEYDIQHPLMFNAGVFLNPDTSGKFVYSLANAIDLFSIWRILLVAVGLKAAGGKRLTFGGALFAVVLPWAVLVLIGAAVAAKFS